MFLRYLFLFCFAFGTGSIIYSQDADVPKTVRKGVLYKKEISFLAAIQTNGFYFGYSLGKIQKYYKTKYLYFDFGKLRDSREYKVNQAYNSNGFLGNYIYGKQNDLWLMKAGRGITRYLSEKSRNKGVAIGLKFEGGITLGITKPYYIQIKDKVDNGITIKDIRYSDETKEAFLNKETILGYSGFRKGLGELGVIPGAFGRVSFSMDPGAFEKSVRAINVGLAIDVFSRRVPILANETNRFIFANFFLNIQFGKRK